jgi:hypothetical protein
MKWYSKSGPQQVSDSRWQQDPFGAGAIAIARGLRLSGSRKRGDCPRVLFSNAVSQPAQAVGRFNQAPQDAAFGSQQVSDSRWAARSIRCGGYSNRPRLAPKRLTGLVITKTWGLSLGFLSLISVPCSPQRREVRQV